MICVLLELGFNRFTVNNSSQRINKRILRSNTFIKYGKHPANQFTFLRHAFHPPYCCKVDGGNCGEI